VQQRDTRENATGAVARPGSPRYRLQPAATAATAICAASMLILGVWAFVAPVSFSHFIDYAPYNRHLIHDAGAFQIGIGVALLLAPHCSDALVVALTGFAVASGRHTLSHYADRRIGGHLTDVPALGLLTLGALCAVYARIHGRRS
jgi:uncharacterized membrane protein